MSVFEGAVNFGFKAARRISSLHKPFVRLSRRRQRAAEHDAFHREVESIDRRLAEIAAGDGPIIAGPWLAEVGYEVLYWVPFLRWFADTYRVPASQLTVVSRGGMERSYAGIAAGYVDLFDLLTPQQLASRNAQRQSDREGGGQKQSDVSTLDQELIAAATARRSASSPQVLHPSLMFRLFRHAWHGNVAMDVFWNHTRYERLRRETFADGLELPLPPEFIAAKLYTGPALSRSDATREALRQLVTRAASGLPLVLLATRFGLDEHDDFDFSGIPGVIDAQRWMTPRTNLDVQLAIVARSRAFLSACGGLAWVAPFIGVPTVAVYDSDHLLAPHLLVERQAGKRTGAAEFSTIDLRATMALGRSLPVL